MSECEEILKRAMQLTALPELTDTGEKTGREANKQKQVTKQR